MSEVTCILLHIIAVISRHSGYQLSKFFLTYNITCISLPSAIGKSVPSVLASLTSADGCSSINSIIYKTLLIAYNGDYIMNN